ncbi:MAG: 30S ribosomal protein S20 [Patescibacteria group bacterium]
MPVKRAAMKALRQNRKRHDRNVAIKNNVRKAVKEARRLLATKDKAKAVEAITIAVKKLDKAAQKGILKKNTAGRLKSRLSLGLRKL